MKRLFLFLILAGCATHYDPNQLTSVQTLDRNGFSETVSNKDRLDSYNNVNFLTPQPYQKVLRVFCRNPDGKSISKITSYHPNGQVFQYLEVVDGRAKGAYKEWYSNGILRLDVTVIEGIADISEQAQASYLFEGMSRVYDEEGRLIAEIPYEKGLLEQTSFYYHNSGKLAKSIPYTHDLIHGTYLIFDESGTIIEKTEYQNGLKNGSSIGVHHKEEYEKDLLLQGTYLDSSGNLIAEVKEGRGNAALFQGGLLYSLIEYQKGEPHGSVKIFNPDGSVHSTYRIQEGKKTGEEIEYYSKSTQPKILLSWREDVLQGTAKTWYENGALESQRELSSNKKEGLSFAWYQDGSLMLMEEYQNDKLLKGSYYKKADKLAVSKVENGKGIATLHDSEGRFVNKIQYEKGVPLAH